MGKQKYGKGWKAVVYVDDEQWDFVPLDTNHSGSVAVGIYEVINWHRKIKKLDLERKVEIKLEYRLASDG